ncbi:ABC transporter ATP-binding protein [Patulibacter sp. S7RM1-6]
MTLVASDVRWAIDGRLILDDVSCRVDTGTFVGLLGPNGSGKSSLLQRVAGVRRPDGGRVLLDDIDLARMDRRELARRRALLAQEAETVELTVREAILLGRTPYRRAFEPDRADDHRRVDRALADTGLEALADRPWPTLSGGERQRARIARALVQDADVLLLDEPTNHLDIRHQLEVLELVRTLGLTVLAALHDLNLAAMHCDRIVVLDRGRVVAAGPPADVLTPGLVREVYGVRCHVHADPRTGRPVVVYEGAERRAIR